MHAPSEPATVPAAEADGDGDRPLRVALAEDSVLLREGIARLLDDAGFEVVAQAGTADDLVRLVAMHKPDVAITDIRMPPTQTDEGLQAAQKIRERQPEVGVVFCRRHLIDEVARSRIVPASTMVMVVSAWECRGCGALLM